MQSSSKLCIINCKEEGPYNHKKIIFKFNKEYRQGEEMNEGFLLHT